MASFSFPLFFSFPLLFVFVFFGTHHEHLHSLFLFQVTFFSAYASLFVLHTFCYIRLVFRLTQMDLCRLYVRDNAVILLPTARADSDP